MPNAKDITGQRFGSLVAETLVGSRKVGNQRKRFWRCRCDCGKTTEVNQGNLTQHRVRSCGCALTLAITRHGKYRTPTYKIWAAMLDRCRNPNNPSYINYGGRGITVCQDWIDFIKFSIDMGERPHGYHNKSPLCAWFDSFRPEQERLPSFTPAPQLGR